MTAECDHVISDEKIGVTGPLMCNNFSHTSEEPAMDEIEGISSPPRDWAHNCKYNIAVGH